MTPFTEYIHGVWQVTNCNMGGNAFCSLVRGGGGEVCVCVLGVVTYYKVLTYPLNTLYVKGQGLYD